jgi:uncharacterized protein (TIGR02996 family)
MTNTDFIRAIVANSADDSPRLIYADYLEEHGDTERSEFIRIQCELARTTPDESHYDPAVMEKQRDRILRLDVYGNSEQKIAAWDFNGLPEILSGEATLVDNPLPTISVDANDYSLEIKHLRVEGNLVLAAIDERRGDRRLEATEESPHLHASRTLIS